MSNNFLHTLYIALPDELRQEIFNIYHNLSLKFQSQYLDERNYSAHITIGTLALSKNDTQKFIDICVSSFEDCQNFLIKLDSFSLSQDHKYIFLDPDNDAFSKIMELRNVFEEKVIPNFPLEISPRFLDRINEFSESEKDLLKKTGSPYVFKPHLSIIKLNPVETEQAMVLLKNHSVLGKSFKAFDLFVSAQSENLDNQFPVQKVINLKN